jgi:hypothetical protein
MRERVILGAMVLRINLLADEGLPIGCSHASSSSKILGHFIQRRAPSLRHCFAIWVSRYGQKMIHAEIQYSATGRASHLKSI